MFGPSKAQDFDWLLRKSQELSLLFGNLKHRLSGGTQSNKGMAETVKHAPPVWWALTGCRQRAIPQTPKSGLFLRWKSFKAASYGPELQLLDSRAGVHCRTTNFNSA